MHEQSIVESLLALALENAEKEKAKKIIRLYLVVGELSGVVEDAVNFHFNFLSRDTIAEGASIFFMNMPAQFQCRNCKTTYSPEKQNYHCPNCGEQKVDIISGRELYLERMEIE